MTAGTRTSTPAARCGCLIPKHAADGPCATYGAPRRQRSGTPAFAVANGGTPMSTSQPVAFNVALGGLLSTGIALAAVLWPERLSPEIQAAIIAFGNAVLLTIFTFLAQRQVTPIATPTLPAGTTVTVAGSEDTVEIPG